MKCLNPLNCVCELCKLYLFLFSFNCNIFIVTYFQTNVLKTFKLSQWLVKKAIALLPVQKN